MPRLLDHPIWCNQQLLFTYNFSPEMAIIILNDNHYYMFDNYFSEGLDDNLNKIVILIVIKMQKGWVILPIAARKLIFDSCCLETVMHAQFEFCYLVKDIEVITSLNMLWSGKIWLIEYNCWYHSQTIIWRFEELKVIIAISQNKILISDQCTCFRNYCWNCMRKKLIHNNGIKQDCMEM